MFGNPTWFRPRSKGWGVRPATWQGWLYSLAWAGVILLPFWGLMARHQVAEAVAWVVVSGGLLALDVRHIRGALAPVTFGAAPSQPEIWFLGEESATPNYNLRLKK